MGEVNFLGKTITLHLNEDTKKWYDKISNPKKFAMMRQVSKENISINDLAVNFSIPNTGLAKRLHDCIKKMVANSENNAQPTPNVQTKEKKKELPTRRYVNFLGKVFNIYLTDEKNQWYDNISDEQKQSMVMRVIGENISKEDF